jgi:hypothetical protein
MSYHFFFSTTQLLYKVRCITIERKRSCPYWIKRVSFFRIRTQVIMKALVLNLHCKDHYLYPIEHGTVFFDYVKKHKDMKRSVLDKTGFCFSMSTQRSTNAFMRKFLFKSFIVLPLPT